MKQENIRNFSIIAHIDHGKSASQKISDFPGALFDFTSSGRMNRPCGKVLPVGKTLGRRSRGGA